MAHEISEPEAARLAQLALDCVHREYPNKIAHVLNSDADLAPPRRLTPAFYGCYDWHSAVHGHWLLVRLARTFPDAELAPRALAALSRSLTAENIDGEVRYAEGEGRLSFERPYGLAWLLQLAAELREWDHPRAREWSRVLAPLESLFAQRLKDYLPKLEHPIRVGEHSQTAFALSLVYDWARTTGDEDMKRLLVSRVEALFLADENCPLGYEPSGEDFLSPCLAEADLLRRILPAARFSSWLSGFLPGIPEDGSADWLEPAVVSDPEDPKLGHLHGLNLSRSWMLEGIASVLAATDPRRAALLASAALHTEKGLAGIASHNYYGSHWLGSFACYLVTRRGIRD